MISLKNYINGAHAKYSLSYDVKPNSNKRIDDLLNIIKKDEFNAINIKRICQSTIVFEIKYNDDDRLQEEKENRLKKLSQILENDFYFLISEIFSDQTKENPNPELDNL